MVSVEAVAPVEAPSMVDRVTEEIRRSIVAGELAPGQEFSLRQIATQLGVSFIPVREALRSLEAEGLLETRRGRSAIVSPLDAGELRAICQLCRQIEPELRERAARLITLVELDRLDGTVAALADPSTSRENCYQLGHELHVDLVAPAATTWDLRILERLWRAMERYVRIGETRTVEREPSRWRWDVAPERDLVAAYRSGDPAAVRAATLGAIAVRERAAERALAPSPLLGSLARLDLAAAPAPAVAPPPAVAPESAARREPAAQLGSASRPDRATLRDPAAAPDPVAEPRPPSEP
jgi:DNA-binding GntR family transcriptional regulator